MTAHDFEVDASADKITGDLREESVTGADHDSVEAIGDSDAPDCLVTHRSRARVCSARSMPNYKLSAREHAPGDGKKPWIDSNDAMIGASHWSGVCIRGRHLFENRRFEASASTKVLKVDEV